MDLIAAMLAGMRQEMAVDREVQAQKAREQAERTDQLAREQAERTDQLAREQAERTDQLAREQAQRADDQVRHLEDVLQSSLASLKAETQQYTDQACDNVRNELLGKVKTLEGEVQGLREEVRTEKQRREMATERAEEQAAPRVLAGTAGVADLLGSAWGPCVVSEPVATSGGWGAIGTTPLSPAGGRLGLRQPPFLPPSPPLSPSPGRPASCPHESRSPPLGPSASRRLGKRKLPRAEKAPQLATALRGPAVEVLGHLPTAQRACYGSVAEALRRRFGHHHQAEVYRARLKKRTQERGETLS
ncbi:hypothetical protein O3P69_009825 [Scylla paramamosain]|uniref:Uncharacterized protein n=1 Tax=Scylla paramamosain TaxID=85552 RepID=A0AAW0SN81_SCYPA